MDQNTIINNLIESTNEVFETMFFAAVSPCPMINDVSEVTNIDIISTVYLAGELSGAISLYCNKKFAINITSYLFSHTPDEIDDKVCDAIGEMANIIAGGLKTKLSKTEDIFEISLPNIVKGNTLTVYQKGYKKTFPRFIIPFKYESDMFYIEIVCKK